MRQSHGNRQALAFVHSYLQKCYQHIARLLLTFSIKEGKTCEEVWITHRLGNRTQILAWCVHGTCTLVTWRGWFQGIWQYVPQL